MSVAAVGGPPRSRSGHRYSGVPARGSRAGRGRLHRPAGAEVHEDDAAALLAHDVVRLDVAVDEPLGVDGGERAAQRPADDDRLVGAVRAARVDLGGQRPPVHELHPQADPAVVLVGAVHDDDVRMLDAGEEAAFVEDPRRQIVAAEARRQQLHRDVPAERIDGAIDLRERAAADRLLETQRAPGPAAQVDVGAGRRRRRPDRFERVVLCDGGYARQHAEALDHRPRLVVGGGPFLGFPVDGLALVDAGGELEEADWQVIVHHGSSP